MKNLTKKDQDLNRLVNLQTREYISHIHKREIFNEEGVLGQTARSYLVVMVNLEEFFRVYKGLSDEELKGFNFLTIKLIDLSAFSEYLRRIKGNSISTHNHRISVVRAFITHLMEFYEDDIDDVTYAKLSRLTNKIKPSLVLPIPSVEKPFFTVNQIAHLHRFILTDKKIRGRERLLALFLLYRDTSNRKDEVRNFVFDDIYFSDIPGESYAITPCKNKSLTEKKHFLKEDTVEALKKYISIRKPKDPNEKSIFLSNYGVKLSTNSVYRIFKNLYIDAGFGYIDEDGKKKTDYVVHSLRHSSITETCFREGIEAASRKAGHASLNMTKRYVHTTDEARQQTAEVAFNYDLYE